MAETPTLTYDIDSLRGDVTEFICSAYSKLKSASETISSLPTPEGCENARNLSEIVDNIKSCVLQTNNYTDIPYIRETSEDARIWYLTDVISEDNINLMKENNVECVNTTSSKNNAYKIKKITENGIDVCVWNVQTDSAKERVKNMGATYVMSDNVLGITPYQEGEEDVNGLEQSD